MTLINATLLTTRDAAQKSKLRETYLSSGLTYQNLRDLKTRYPDEQLKVQIDFYFEKAELDEFTKLDSMFYTNF